MAQEDKELLREIIRSVDRTLSWETAPGKEGGLRLTVKNKHGEASCDITDTRLSDALEDDAISRNELRELVKRTRRRIFTHRKPYMPWRMPKIVPIGAPGPRSGGWGGGGGGGGGGGRR